MTGAAGRCTDAGRRVTGNGGGGRNGRGTDTKRAVRGGDADSPGVLMKNGTLRTAGGMKRFPAGAVEEMGAAPDARQRMVPAARRMRSARSHNAPRSCSFSAAVKSVGFPLPSMPSILW